MPAPGTPGEKGLIMETVDSCEVEAQEETASGEADTNLVACCEASAPHAPSKRQSVAKK